MRTLKIAIVEDEKTHAELLRKYLLEWLQRNHIHPNISLFGSAEKFLFIWEEDQCFDALFLDIQMPGMNGVELAKRIRRQNPEISLVFTTGITDYLREGYEVAAIHYLVKPLEPEQVADCMERICTKREDADEISFTTEAEDEQTKERCYVRFMAGEIQYIEAFGHYTRVQTERSAFRIKKGIRQWQDELAGEPFVFSHRSYLVNLSYASRINKNNIVLDNGKTVPLSRRNWKPFHDAFIRYYERA